MRVLTLLSLGFFVVACSSSDPGGGSGDDAGDADVQCSYPAPSNDPRCDTVTFGATCDGSFSCTWPGQGDCPANGCCADRVCRCYGAFGADAGADGDADADASPVLGRWACAQ